MKKFDSVEDRFLDKVEKTDDCWTWIGKKLSVPPNNYGRFWFDGKWHLAHRISYRLFRGEMQSGYVVCHACDNPQCVNPEHLFIGKQEDNIVDMCNKGRQSAPKGEKAGRSKLVKSQVIEIKKRCLNKYRGLYAELAREYGVTPAAIRAISEGRAWASVRL